MKESVSGKAVVGDWTVEPGLDRLRRGDIEVGLEPRQMDVLMYLAGRRGEVVSADALIGEVWKGIVVSDDAVYQCISKLREALGDDSQNPRYIETIPKRGYRLIAPARYVDEQNGDTDAPELTSKTTYGARRKGLALTGLLVLVLLVAIYQFSDLNKAPSAPEHSIAVLAFTDLSPDGDQEYFADGIAEDLLNALATVPQLKVTGRTSSFTFRERNEDLRIIGEVLGVAHVLEGSVRRDGNRVRVTAQLIDAKSGFHLWSGTYDRKLTDIFAIQEEISRAIADALKVRLLTAGEDPSIVRAAGDVGAYNLYLLGRHHIDKRTRADLERATGYFQQALVLDPDYADPYVGLAEANLLPFIGVSDIYLLIINDTGDGGLSAADAVARALPFIEKALALIPEMAEAYASLGLLRMVERDYAAAETALKRAIALNPNFSRAYAWLSSTLANQNKDRESFEALSRSLELDPLSLRANVNMIRALALRNRMADARGAAKRFTEMYPDSPLPYFSLSQVYFFNGDLVQTVRFLEKSLSLDPDLPGPRNMLGFIYAMLGDMDKSLELMRGFPERGLLQLAWGQPEEGLDTVHDHLRAAPDNPLMVMLAAEAEIYAGNLSLARAHLEPLAEPGTDGRLFRNFLPSLAAVHLAALRRMDGDEARARALLANARTFLEAQWYEGLDFLHLDYLSARILALEGQQDEALETLGKAIGRGWLAYWFVDLDIAFANLHATPEFQSLLADLAAESSRQRAILEASGGE
jgi:TolB-like protein/DNA-binding winged helix-turn-helix (wHTH) protein/Tfp pilus assembly protein PilF